MPRKYISKSIREKVAERAGGYCEYCKFLVKYSPDPFAYEHIIPLFHPRKDNWSDHFTWTKDALKIVGLTTTGRATITRLQTNRAALIHFRRLLLLTEEHPPK